MEWKVYLLFFALFVAATFAAPTCKCQDEDKETLSKYKVKAKDGDEEYEQEVKIDTEKQTETYHIPKTKSSSAGEVDEVYDFKRNLVMRRMPEHKACFLSESTENAPKPQDLKNALDKQSASGSSQSANTTEDDYEVVGTVNDRSTLSDEMAAMCAKFPIYRIKRKQVTMSVEKENIQGGKDRVKRDLCIYCYWYIQRYVLVQTSNGYYYCPIWRRVCIFVTCSY
ncbi:unnamed protein product [Pocillopora meandrina]|uniref:BRICHOS domain-containing protein n=1 Tax=Pocillopora meandrina TaxID=46732 RepID=A0AAU9WTU6_9CNID|nr:unnamed protein product [Pocillopora meandrina]